MKDNLGSRAARTATQKKEARLEQQRGFRQWVDRTLLDPHLFKTFKAVKQKNVEKVWGQ
jgi:hypothetical protein